MTSMADIILIRTDSSDERFGELIKELTAFLSILNGEMDAFYAPHNSVDLIRNVVVALQNDIPVGCGAFKAIDPKHVEIKRMYVHPDQRGKGVGRMVLAELEAWATELDFQSARLETSKRLETAVNLYQTSGYQVTPNFPPYEGVDDSVCMRKAL